MADTQGTEDPAVTNFREYLRFKTVEPEPDYDGAISFLKRMAGEMGLPVQCVEVHPGKTIVIITWEGTDPTLKSIVLNSHMDVVPVFPEHWVCDPFEAKKMENGDIYARGTQDMKSVGIQYIEAVRRLIKRGEHLLRTVHMLFVPDEEIGGFKGMKLFVKTPEFAKLNMGFGLDEGLANPTEKFTLFYGERATWWIDVKCTGDPGHALNFVQNTAADKARKVMNAFLGYRDEEMKKLSTKKLGDIQTVNLTAMSGGVARNVVPAELQLQFDLRLSPWTKPEFLENKIEEFIAAGGEGVSYEWYRKGVCYTTPLEDSNVWWTTFKATCDKERLELETEIFPAATDSCYIRALGIPVLGFSPINNTKILLHDHNEFLNEGVFLRGIAIYESLIAAIANVPA